MRKYGVYSQIIFFSILLAGLFGILHDQITYSISPEYFTEFKYNQFGFEPSHFGGHWQTVAIIGFLATWWVGLFIGFLIGLSTLIFKPHTLMRKQAIISLKITFLITVLFSIVGFFYGKFYLAKTGVNWHIPETVISKTQFITVGSIHNASYLGGLVGLIIALFRLFLLNYKYKRPKRSI